MAESTIESKRNSLIIRIIIWEAIIIFLCSIFVRSPQKKKFICVIEFIFYVYIITNICIWNTYISILFCI